MVRAVRSPPVPRHRPKYVPVPWPLQLQLLRRQVVAETLPLQIFLGIHTSFRFCVIWFRSCQRLLQIGLSLQKNTG